MFKWKIDLNDILLTHQAIAGSTHAIMTGVGHFPMQENPEEFAAYLLPVLDQIASG